MLRTSLFAAIALLLATGFTFFSNPWNGETPIPDNAIFYAIENNPNWLKVKDGVQIKAEALVNRHRVELSLGTGDELKLLRQEEDNLGFTHYRYQHYFKGIKVQGSQMLVHEKDGYVKTVNGRLATRLQTVSSPKISSAKAVEKALAYLPAERYMWESDEEERLLKRVTNDPTATHFPKPELVLLDPTFDLLSENMRLAYSLTVYAMQPHAQKWLFVDALTGEVFHEIDMLHTQVQNTPGVAETKYHGQHEIITDSVGVDSFRLVETTRGRGIETYNLRGSTQINDAVDFWDDDNYWNNVNAEQDEAATDAHWSAEMTFDYYFQKFNHVGIDGDSFPLVSYVHYDQNVTNAFWNGTHARFGDGGGSSTALTSLDVVGHEFTHGVTRFSANLIYQDESGALNESFSDIFGAAVEFFADSANGDWLVGEDFLDEPFRNMADPNEYGDPDTYFGTSWFLSSADNGGVHTNSGVQNFWFYLLTEGKTDINDFDNNYEVIGLGIDSAAQIAFRNLQYYLMETSRYPDARMGAILAAQDLYGECSFAETQTRNAWYAVGVGSLTPSLDMGITKIIGLPPFRCGVTDKEPLTIEVVYNDCDSVLLVGTKIPVYYQINGAAPVWDSIQLSNDLQSGDTLVFTFGQTLGELALAGYFEIETGVLFPNDNTSGNNKQKIIVERIFDQNVDFSVPSVPLPRPGCFLENETVAVEIGFYGCDSIAAGEVMDVYYQVNGGATVSETITNPTTLFYGESFFHTFSQQVDLSSIFNHDIDAWVVYQPDTLNGNDIYVDQMVVKPVRMVLADTVTFDAGLLSQDSFFVITADQSQAFVSNESARDGEFGLQVMGGDLFKAMADGNFVLPTPENVWDVNPTFQTTVCFCADLTNLQSATFKYRIKQFYSLYYERELGEILPQAAAARLTVDGVQLGANIYPLDNTNSLYFNKTANLSDYLGNVVEICIETSTLMDRNLDPYGIGDVVYLDNVTIVGELVNPTSELTFVENLLVFPNPNSGRFSVGLTALSNRNVDLQVVDLLGRPVFATNVDLTVGDNQFDLVLTDVPGGVYFLQVISEGEKMVKELVVF
ncbi:MAG: M4 family metallopeptidase [Saprospiraceae bacterium]